MADKCQICKKTVKQIKEGMLPFFDCSCAKNRMHVFNGRALDFTDDEKKQQIVEFLTPVMKKMTYEKFTAEWYGESVRYVDRALLTPEALTYLFFTIVSDVFSDKEEIRLGKEIFAEKFPQIYNMIFGDE